MFSLASFQKTLLFLERKDALLFEIKLNCNRHVDDRRHLTAISPHHPLIILFYAIAAITCIRIVAVIL